jgi:peroxiredoxin Q/BCP
MTTLGPGDPAPDFELDTDSGARFRLSAHRGRPVVIFFYPEDDTEGCTIENIEFTQLAGEFNELGVAVLGVSPDSVESHCDFRDKYDLKVPLAADTGRAVIDAYGVWGPKKLYGREYEGLHRTTFLIDGDGRVAAAWGVRRIKGHARAALDRARELVGAG